MPSRASLLTGRYPNAHGVWHNGVPLPRASYTAVNPQDNEVSQRLYHRDMVCHVPTLADVLAHAGYQTRAVGKLHLTPFRAPACYRFEEASSLWHDPKMVDWHGPYYGFERVDLAIGHGEGTPGHYRHWLQLNSPDVVKALQKGEHRKALPFPQVGDLYASAIPEEAHHSTWVGECVCEFLEKGRDTQKPFLLFAGFPDPHHPFTPPARLAEEFAGRPTLPPHFDERELTTKPHALVELMKGVNPGTVSMLARGLPPGAITRIRQHTDAMVHLIDRAVGRVLEALKRLNLWDNTITIFTSDHGDFLGDHHLLRKETLCSHSLVHVPFLMRVPTTAGAVWPTQTHVPMSNADVLPTLCELAHVPLPSGVQGRSILPALQGVDPHPVLVFAYSTDPRHHNFSLYDSRHRFTWYPVTDERELYDHQDDPHELHNRVGDTGLAEHQEKLFQTLLRLHCQTDNPHLGRVAIW
jgi:arylsulfatase A-like enzyme